MGGIEEEFSEYWCSEKGDYSYELYKIKTHKKDIETNLFLLNGFVIFLSIFNFYLLYLINNL